uniref:Uncharacterized protein n=1 Tax=Anguilla anguilla TaxID=7936 RepID=A0A0E9QZ92_ANGAN
MSVKYQQFATICTVYLGLT